MTRRAFDFVSFVQDLVAMPAGEMAARTQQEMNRVLSESTREPHIEFQRAFYTRKLARLLQFLQHHDIPQDLMPKERAAYLKLAGDLLRRGEAPNELLVALHA